jgi:hypothetical protein
MGNLLARLLAQQEAIQICHVNCQTHVCTLVHESSIFVAECGHMLAAMRGTVNDVMPYNAVLLRLASRKERPRTRAAGSVTARTGATSLSACWHLSRGRLQVGMQSFPSFIMIHIAHLAGEMQAAAVWHRKARSYCTFRIKQWQFRSHSPVILTCPLLCT